MGQPLMLSIAVALGLVLAGCSGKPTYPKERLGESLQQVLVDDGVSQASVRFLDHTLAVQIAMPDALQQEADGSVGVGSAFGDLGIKVLSGIHRVVLSSDADVRFYVLLISDPNIPGAYLTLVRYVDDLRRFQANMLEMGEMFARTILELNAGPAGLTLEEYLPRDIRLEEFLSWQLARRIQRALVEEFQVAGAVEVGRCGGEFDNGEFILTLNVAPGAEPAFSDATVQQIFDTSSTVIATVLSKYQFEGFQAVRLVLPTLGRNVVLPKTQLQAFR
ncbi:MAG: hypothetical protein HY601_02555 [Candidatus Omnitrophica bacterium]|nr:hypothetical protein [Candidatus Omnitrophota bacterium]